MARYDNAHSRLVAWLKILLPLAALAILSTIFLFSRTIDPSRAIPFSKVDVRALAREPRITAPDYSGMTSDGTAISATAASARPDPSQPGKATAHLVHATLTTRSGGVAHITAQDGKIDNTAGRMVLTGHVTLVTSDGYTVTSPRMVTQLHETDIVGDGPVDATGPLGHLTAGHMHLTRPQAPNEASAGYVLVFKGGVKLIYHPQT